MDGQWPFAYRDHSNNEQDHRKQDYMQSCREIENVMEIITPKSLLQLFELDFNDMASSNFPEDLSYSQEDRRFLKVSDGIKHTGGHYEIPLPFRQTEVQLPNNRQQAFREPCGNGRRCCRTRSTVAIM